jgi:hypothetical protein
MLRRVDFDAAAIFPTTPDTTRLIWPEDAPLLDTFIKGYANALEIGRTIAGPNGDISGY